MLYNLLRSDLAILKILVPKCLFTQATCEVCGDMILVSFPCGVQSSVWLALMGSLEQEINYRRSVKYIEVWRDACRVQSQRVEVRSTTGAKPT